ncbi:MAG: FtsX-like permease family protein [Luteitalea sp.]|nr:FtsX-like permease family protein [Luteitalea sp.]
MALRQGKKGSTVRTLLSRVWFYLRRRRFDRELDEELAFHLEEKTHTLEASGLPADKAHTTARRALGGALRARERSGDVWAWQFLDELTQDLRFTLRSLRRAPVLTFSVIGTLALGIGATTAIFSGVNAVFLRPLPFPDADRLVFVWETVGEQDRISVTAPDFLDWHRDQRVFERLAAFTSTTVALTAGSEAERLPARRVSADYFRVLRVRPALGRDFTAADEPFGAPKTLLLSDALWRNRFGADPSVLNRELILNGERHTVIGVLPPNVVLEEEAEQLYLPLALTPAERSQPGNRFLRVIARLAPAVSFEHAQSAMAAIMARLALLRPQSNRDWSARLTDMHDTLVGDLGRPLLVLMAAVALVLLIACANVANLQLVRATSRQREVAIRAALGAGRHRILRQSLVESLVLALLGGGAGVLVGAWSAQLMPWLLPDTEPRFAGSILDVRLLAFAAVVTIATGLLFGSAPAWQLSRPDLRDRLSEGGRGTARPERHRVSGMLVVIEIALALALLIGAGLLMRSFLSLQATEPGVRTEGVLTFRVSLPEARYPESAHVSTFFATVLERIRAVPQVMSAGATSALPLRGSGVNLVAPIDGRPKPEFPMFFYRGVTRGYFRALGIAVVKGRDFSPDDREGRPRVAIINQTAARQYWPNDDPIGARLHPDDAGEPVEVIGVVSDTKHFGLRQEPRPELFIAMSQLPPPFWGWMERSMDLVVRTSGEPAQLAAPTRAVVRALDPALPIYQMMTMEEVVSESLATPRKYVLLMVVFGTIALLLAAIGIYGVMAFIVTRRTHEIGVRVALGASRRDILTFVLGRSLRLSAIGLALGVGAALVLSRSIATFLVGVTATDVLTYGAVSALLLVVALVATYIPAQRALRVDPVRALRTE